MHSSRALPRSASPAHSITRTLALLAFGLSTSDGVVLEGTINPGEEPTVFAVIGDFGHVHSAWGPAQVASMLKSWKPDFVLAAGDVNYGNTTLGHSDWDSRIGTRYGDLIVGRGDNKYPFQVSPTQRFFPVIGNHDTTGGGLGGGDVRGYVDYFVRNSPGSPERLPTGSGVHGNEVTYYDFHWDDMHFIMADSDRGRQDAAFAEAQNAWIRHALETSAASWKFVVFHHAAWSSDAFHSSQAWMQGPHLSMADAVFAGHAHVYERLEVDGTPFFTSGISGKSFYPFRSPPLPQSLFRHNSSFGALRVTKNNTGALCEFLNIADGTNGATGGTVIDSLTLRDYQPVSNTGRHPLEAVAGQVIQIETSLPIPSGGGVNTLDPRIEVLGPDGLLVAEDEDSAIGGVNAKLSFVAAASGRHILAVIPEGATAGSYQVSVTAVPASPTDPYELWAAQHFGFGAAPSSSSPAANPDGDDRNNLLEFAAGSDPLGPDHGTNGTILAPRSLGNVIHLDIPLAAGLREGVIYEIQASSSLDGGVWTSIASHSTASGWTGTAPVVTSPGEGESTVLRISESGFPFPENRRFYRMRVRESIPTP